MQTHTGSCHCGAITFEVDADLSSPIACNCSMCGRSGALMVFVPAARFRLLTGEEVLRDYQFGKEHVHHRFCNICGLKPFADGEDANGGRTYAINIRCVEGVDVQAVEPTWYNGKAL